MIKPKLYATDGLAADVIFDGLRPALERFRQRYAGTRAVALYRSSDSAQGFVVLSESRSANASAMVANERLALSHALASEPSVIRRLVATSQTRDFELYFAAALTLPWVDAFGTGALLIDLESGASQVPASEHHRDIVELADLADDLARSRLQATASMQRAVIEAMRGALLAGLPSGGTTWRLRFLTEAVRVFFRAETAHLALPMYKHALGYDFVSVASLRPSTLRVAWGCGVCAPAGYASAARGGQSHQEGSYSGESELSNATTSSSLLFAPLFVPRWGVGSLALTSGLDRTFGISDANILEEFGEYLGMLIDHLQLLNALPLHFPSYSDDFTHSVHDSVVRSLLQIGFTAEEAARTVEDQVASRAISRICTLVESSLDEVRADLRQLMPLPLAANPPAGLSHVLERLSRIPVLADMRRRIVVVDVGTEGDPYIPDATVRFLTRVTAESLLRVRPRNEAAAVVLEVRNLPGELMIVISHDDDHQDALLSGSAGLALHRQAAASGAELEMFICSAGKAHVMARVPKQW